MLARLSHPNIVAVFDDGTEDGVAFFVMELVHGRSVASLLADGPLPVAEAVRIAAQVCDALSAAHAAGVIHRDIKPGNILVTPRGDVKVCDFGIARLQYDATLTTANVAFGTSSYMAPEQVEGRPVDGRTDLYALGCVLFEMLTGTPPFAGDSPLSVAYQHVNNEPPTAGERRPEIPAELDRLVSRVLTKVPDDRPDNADQLRAELAPFAGLPSTSRSPVLADDHSHRRRFSRPGIAAAAAVVAVPVVLFVAQMFGEQQPQAARPDVVATSTAGSPSPSATVPVIVPPVIVSATPTLTRPSPPRPSQSPSVMPPVVWTPLGEVTALRGVVQNLVVTGQLAQRDADDLDHQLRDLASSIDHNKQKEALDRIGGVQKKIDDLLKGGKISAAGHDAIAAGLARLRAGLPPGGPGPGGPGPGG